MTACCVQSCPLFHSARNRRLIPDQHQAHKASTTVANTNTYPKNRQRRKRSSTSFQHQTYPQNFIQHYPTLAEQQVGVKVGVIFHFRTKKRKRVPSQKLRTLGITGRGGGIRTRDPLHPINVKRRISRSHRAPPNLNTTLFTNNYLV